MKVSFTAMALAIVLVGCAFTPPKPPQPADSPQVPVNATAPLQASGVVHE